MKARSILMQLKNYVHYISYLIPFYMFSGTRESGQTGKGEGRGRGTGGKIKSSAETREARKAGKANAHSLPSNF